MRRHSKGLDSLFWYFSPGATNYNFSICLYPTSYCQTCQHPNKDLGDLYPFVFFPRVNPLDFFFFCCCLPFIELLLGVAGFQITILCPVIFILLNPYFAVHWEDTCLSPLFSVFTSFIACYKMEACLEQKGYTGLSFAIAQSPKWQYNPLFSGHDHVCHNVLQEKDFTGRAKSQYLHITQAGILILFFFFFFKPFEQFFKICTLDGHVLGNPFLTAFL